MSFRSWSLMTSIALAACGTSTTTPEPTDPASTEPAGGNLDKPFMPVAMSAEAMQAAADTRTPMRFVMAGDDTGPGGVDITLDVDGKPTTWHLDVDLVALRVADIATLEYPIGTVRFDALSLTRDGLDETTTTAAIKTLFRRLGGAPVQLFFDAQSVTELQGRLRDAGSSARATVLGVIQVEDRQQEVELDVMFERPTEDAFIAKVAPFTLSAADVAFDDDLAKLADVLGVRRVADTVTLEAEVRMAAFDGELLPSFVRTPVTVNTMEEVRAKVDAAVDDFEAAEVGMKRAGIPKALRDKLTPEQYERMREIKERKRRVNKSGRSLFHQYNTADEER